MSTFARIIRRSLLPVFALAALVFGMISGEPYIVSGDMRIVRSQVYNYCDGVLFCQGLAADETYFYGVGAIKPICYNTLVKIDVETGKIVQTHEMCLPRELVRRGYSHLGDACLYDGRLFIALEDDLFLHPAVAEYDPGTLEYLTYHVVPDECVGSGNIPWCAVADGVLYFSQSNRVDEIRMLDVTDFSFIGALKLDMELFKVQGGEVYDGKLYITTDQGIREKTMIAVDIETGHAEPVFTRCTGRLDAEGEGIAIYPYADGSLFHIIDVAAQTRITSYKPE